MQSAEVLKASQRAVLVALLSIGVAFGSATISSAGTDAILYLLVGLLLVALAAFGIYKRVLDSLYRIGGRKLATFFALFFPITSLVTFALYPLAVGLVASLGATVRTNFALIAAISAVLAIANLAVLVMNILDLRRSRPDPG